MFLCTHAVPPPQITITVSPVNVPFFAGVLFNLTCSIQLDLAVDTQFNVTGMWTRSGTPLTNGSRITVYGTSESASSQHLFQTRVQFSPLIDADDGLFTCQAIVEPQTPQSIFIVGTTAANMLQINVTGK